jgi:hypothetical protein
MATAAGARRATLWLIDGFTSVSAHQAYTPLTAFCRVGNEHNKTLAS